MLEKLANHSTFHSYCECFTGIFPLNFFFFVTCVCLYAYKQAPMTFPVISFCSFLMMYRTYWHYSIFLSFNFISILRSRKCSTTIADGFCRETDPNMLHSSQTGQRLGPKKKRNMLLPKERTRWTRVGSKLFVSVCYLLFTEHFHLFMMQKQCAKLMQYVMHLEACFFRSF